MEMAAPDGNRMEIGSSFEVEQSVDAGDKLHSEMFPGFSPESSDQPPHVALKSEHAHGEGQASSPETETAVAAELAQTTPETANVDSIDTPAATEAAPVPEAAPAAVEADAVATEAVLASDAAGSAPIEAVDVSEKTQQAAPERVNFQPANEATKSEPSQAQRENTSSTKSKSSGGIGLRPVFRPCGIAPPTFQKAAHDAEMTLYLEWQYREKQRAQKAAERQQKREEEEDTKDEDAPMTVADMCRPDDEAPPPAEDLNSPPKPVRTIPFQSLSTKAMLTESIRTLEQNEARKKKQGVAWQRYLESLDLPSTKEDSRLEPGRLRDMEQEQSTALEQRPPAFEMDPLQKKELGPKLSSRAMKPRDMHLSRGDSPQPVSGGMMGSTLGAKSWDSSAMNGPFNQTYPPPGMAADGSVLMRPLTHLGFVRGDGGSTPAVKQLAKLRKLHRIPEPEELDPPPPIGERIPRHEKKYLKAFRLVCNYGPPTTLPPCELTYKMSQEVYRKPPVTLSKSLKASINRSRSMGLSESVGTLGSKRATKSAPSQDLRRPKIKTSEIYDLDSLPASQCTVASSAMAQEAAVTALEAMWETANIYTTLEQSLVACNTEKLYTTRQMVSVEKVTRCELMEIESRTWKHDILRPWEAWVRVNQSLSDPEPMPVSETDSLIELLDEFCTHKTLVTTVGKVLLQQLQEPAFREAMRSKPNSLQVLLDAMRYWSLHEVQITVLCQVVATVMKGARSSYRGIAADITPCVLEALSKFPQNMQLVTHGADCIALITNASSNHAQQSIVDCGGVDVLALLLDQHSGHPDVLISVTNALAATSYSGNCKGVKGSAGSVAVSKKGIVAMVIRNMNNHGALSRLLTASMALLANLSALNNISRMAIYKEGGIGTILKAMMDYPSNYNLIVQGINALTQIAARTELRQHVVDAGGRSIVIGIFNTLDPDHPKKTALESKCASLLKSFPARQPTPKNNGWYLDHRLLVHCRLVPDHEHKLLWLPCKEGLPLVMSALGQQFSISQFQLFGLFPPSTEPEPESFASATSTNPPLSPSSPCSTYSLSPTSGHRSELLAKTPPSSSMRNKHTQQQPIAFVSPNVRTAASADAMVPYAKPEEDGIWVELDCEEALQEFFEHSNNPKQVPRLTVMVAGESP